MSLKLTTPSDRQIVVTREFNAPRAKVWDAFTRPDLVRKWCLGPPGWEMTECATDLTVGGTFRHAWKGPGGAAMAMHGVHREIVPPERIVRTETFDFGCAPQMGEQVGTLVLTEQGTRTLMTLTLVYPSKEARDGAVASGMEHGMAAGYQRLDAVLAE